MAVIPKKSINDFFRDKHGDVVLYQAPNAPLIVFIISGLVAAFSSGWLFALAVLAAGISLAVWAYFEIVSGVTPFRQALGWSVIVALAITIVGWLVKIIFG